MADKARDEVNDGEKFELGGWIGLSVGLVGLELILIGPACRASSFMRGQVNFSVGQYVFAQAGQVIAAAPLQADTTFGRVFAVVVGDQTGTALDGTVAHRADDVPAHGDGVERSGFSTLKARDQNQLELVFKNLGVDGVQLRNMPLNKPWFNMVSIVADGLQLLGGLGQK